MSSVADATLRSLSGYPYPTAVCVFIGFATSDYAGGICVAAVGDFAGFDALWFTYLLYWILIDALGSRFSYGFLFRWNCIQLVDAWTRNSLSYDVASITWKGGSCLEASVKVELKVGPCMLGSSRTNYLLVDAARCKQI